MQIRLLTDVSFVMGAYESGSLLECESDDGEGLVKMGLAEVVTESIPPPEATMQAGAPERATLPRARARG
jgi:hypothetical protein